MNLLSVNCIHFRLFKKYFHLLVPDLQHNHKSFAHENQPFLFMSFWGQNLVQNFITELQHPNNYTRRRICSRETTIQSIHGNKKTSSRDTDTICSWKPTKQTNTQFKYSIVTTKSGWWFTNGKFYIGMKAERVQVSRTSSLST
jgi:hypothetical protein